MEACWFLDPWEKYCLTPEDIHLFMIVHIQLAQNHSPDRIKEEKYTRTLQCNLELKKMIFMFWRKHETQDHALPSTVSTMTLSLIVYSTCCMVKGSKYALIHSAVKNEYFLPMSC